MMPYKLLTLTLSATLFSSEPQSQHPIVTTDHAPILTLAGPFRSSVPNPQASITTAHVHSPTCTDLPLASSISSATTSTTSSLSSLSFETSGATGSVTATAISSSLSSISFDTADATGSVTAISASGSSAASIVGDTKMK